MKNNENIDEPFINIIKFANDPELWKNRKNRLLEILDKDLKRKDFIEKHLSENFRYLIADKKLQDSMINLIFCRLINPFQSPDATFMIYFDFSERKIFKENHFEIEVKLKDIATNCKVINKKELRETFHKLLYRLGYEIGYTQGMIDRIDLDLKIIKNEKEGLFIDESILDIQKIFFDYVTKIVKEQNHLYNYLFPFDNYFFSSHETTSEREFSRFISDITENNIDSEAIRNTYLKHKKLKKIPKLW